MSGVTPPPNTSITGYTRAEPKAGTFEELTGIHPPPPSTPAPTSTPAPASVDMPASVSAIGMSPEGLLAYCSARLNSLDEQMNQIFNTQTTNSNLTTAIDQIATLISDAPGPDSNTPPMVTLNTTQNPNLQSQIDAAYSAAIQDATNAKPPNLQLANSLTQDKSAFDANVNGSSGIQSDDLNGYANSLKNYANNLNNDSQMQMITLQSLMSDQETAVQLTTNLVQSLDQQSQDITKNVGQ